MSAFRDPRFREAETTAALADHVVEDRELAIEMYQEAAEGFAAVAVSVVDDAYARSAIAISAATCFVLADRHDLAIQFARQMLDRPDALSRRGRAELSMIAREPTPPGCGAGRPRK